MAGLPELAACTSMHLVARLLAVFAEVAVACPLPPIYMPSTAATGMGFSLGLLLLCISQMGGAAGHHHGTFYMHHMWAGLVAMFVARWVQISEVLIFLEVLMYLLFLQAYCVQDGSGCCLLCPGWVHTGGTGGEM